MITVFLEDVWEEIISKRGFMLFKQKGITFEGNLFKNRAINYNKLKKIDLIVATNPSLSILSWAQKHHIPVIFYALFPDLITEWNYKKNTYREGLTNGFEKKVRKVHRILVNSCFTKELLESRFKFVIDQDVCYLGIDSRSISNRNQYFLKKPGKQSILWNHMWRKDKGFIPALSIILKLAEKYSNIDFYIGRKENWGGKDLYELKEFYKEFMHQIKEKKIKNIIFSKKFYKQEDYWNFLRSMDISFTCSYHETFGISMLEQAAVGIACVVPNVEVYPEIHKGALLVSPDKIIEGVEKLIRNEKACKRISNLCKENASSYNIENFVDNFSQHIFTVLKLNK
ncbi:MAG: glycosyltransferase [Candidatus Levybacteria bacterium]|nr:glycosyltransferase [Candidatus Levybacteria bacterium]